MRLLVIDLPSSRPTTRPPTSEPDRFYAGERAVERPVNTPRPCRSGTMDDGQRAGAPGLDRAHIHYGGSVQVAVTGGAGFIGHHLVAALLARGDRVAVIDDFSSGRRVRLDGLDGELTVIDGTILDAAALDRTFRGCELVLHHAAIASVAQSVQSPRLVNDVNANGTIEVMLAAARARVRRVVFAGSSAVYGVPAELPCRETQRPQPVSPYGASKLAGEHMVHSLGRLRGVESVVLRYFNVYGPGQDPAAEYAAVVPRFVQAVRFGEQPVINGSPEISRDFVYVADVVNANVLAGEATSPSGLTCNIASGTRTTLGDLLAAVCRAAGRDVTPVIGPSREGDIRDSVADIGIAGDALGYRPSVSLDEGIARVLAAQDLPQ
jgi:UDP-glucose 4-epimerase